MKSSLIPEKPILIYPSLAATLGLDESVMLSTLADCVRYITANQHNGFEWYELQHSTVCELLPFWNQRDIQRVSTNLREKGIIIITSPPFGSSERFTFAFNDASAQTLDNSEPKTSRESHHMAQQSPAYISSPHRSSLTPQNAGHTKTNRPDRSIPPVSQAHFMSKNFIPANWQPEQDMLDQLAQHAIPRAFCLEQVPEFVTYWRERGEAHHSWGSKFLQHALRQWRSFEENRYKREQEHPMHAQWRPSRDAMDILVQQALIRREFIEDAIPEFILYWQERGDRLKTWNSKFIQHVRLQWKKFNSALEHSTDPKMIRADWQPSEDVYDVLRLANIEISFAQGLIPEFVLYWRDTNQVHTSWNTRYLQHVKRNWAKRLSMANTSSPDSTANRSTRDISLEEQLTDRSWAN